MGFKFKKTKSIFGHNPLKEKKNTMTEIAKLLDDEEFAKAYPLLESAIKKYPNEVLLWDMLSAVGLELELRTVMQRAFAKMVQFRPNEPDHWYNLAAVYLADGYFALALRIFTEFVQRFPFDEKCKDALKTADAIEKEVTLMLEINNLPSDEGGKKIAVSHDRVQLFMHLNEFDKSIETANELIKTHPDFIPVHNNLSIVYFMKGDATKAVQIAESVIEKQPENFQALGNLIRFSVFLDRKEEARNYAARLKEVKSDFDEIYTKKIESLAFLGDDESVVKIYQEIAKKKIHLKQAGFIKHLAAFSFYQLGNEKKAKKLWEEASEAGSDEADKNLAELQLPIGERNVYALGMRYWLSDLYFKEVDCFLDETKNDDDGEKLKKKLNSFIEKHPHLISNFSSILERSDKSAKQLFINVIKWSENPAALEVLKEFALGKSGSDAIRTKAAVTLKELGIFPKTVKLWVRGEQSEISIRSYLITGEPSVDRDYPMNPEAKELFDKGIRAMQNNNPKVAEGYYKKVAEIQADHPSLVNNFLALKQSQGKKLEIEKELRNLYSRFPEYRFGALRLGIWEVDHGNIETAKAIIKKFEDKEEWHISEFNLFATLQIEICLKEKLFEGARSWFSRMMDFNEGFENTEQEEEAFKELESRIEMADLLNKFSSSKWFGKSRKKKK